MKVLVVNAGSSSLKFTLFEMSNEQIEASGQIERIGQSVPRLIYKRPGKDSITKDLSIKNHTEALNSIAEILTDSEVGVLKSLSEIDAIGHRIVHGGEKICQPVIIDAAVKQIINDCCSLAPLHNPPNLAALEACEKLLPGVPNVGIFDTAFHQTMAPEAFLYAIPYDLYKNHGIRRYGFHGTSHHYVSQATAKFLGKPYDQLKMITCHIGNGGSMAAISGGKVLDTSMGLTPLEGLVMGTRAGNVDAGIVLHLINRLGKTPQEADNILNKQSGLMGLTGVSDMRDTVEKAQQGDELAKTAIKMFARRVQKYIGAYYVLLGGADAIVFTGGIGEYGTDMREMILSGLQVLGIELDKEKNNKTHGSVAVISTPTSKVTAVVMPTNEELMIARQTNELLAKI